jgi:hypothetical protein
MSSVMRFFSQPVTRQFVITQGLGHRRIYKDAGVLKTVIEFLS